MRILRVTLLLAALSASAQVWNSNAGGWNTGYGTVYGSFGLAAATQGIYNTAQQNLQRAILRQTMINKFGLAAVEKAEAEARRGQPSSAPQGLTVSPPPPAPKNVGLFKPGKSTVPKQLGDALGSTPEEKAALTALVTETRKAFEAQPETKAWRNNVAGALAFFLISNVVIATGRPEPSDDTSQAVFAAITQTLDESADFARASAKDKQALYDLLIGFTALPLAIFTEAQDRGDAAQMKQARELAANLLELVLKVEPSQLSLP